MATKLSSTDIGEIDSEMTLSVVKQTFSLVPFPNRTTSVTTLYVILDNVLKYCQHRSRLFSY